MPIRKSHSKSRYGCLPCKKRHTKCGEELPSCEKCVNRRENCIYGLSRATSSDRTFVETANRSANAGAVTGLADTHPVNGRNHYETQIPPNYRRGQYTLNQIPPRTTRLQELELMIHYTTVTYETMAHGPEDLDIWRKVVPEEAVRYEFLMDGLLSLSALHFASENPISQSEYTELAIEYHNSSLRKYKHALEDISDENIHALFACSVVIVILVLAFPNVCEHPVHTSHAQSVMSMCELLQGVQFINSATELPLHKGKLEGLFRRHFSQEAACTKPSGEVSSAMLRLRERATNTEEPIEIQKMYLTGIDSLEEAFGLMASSTHLAPVIAWPTTIDLALLRLLKHGDPMADLIFIHYGVLLLQVRDRWWGKDTGVGFIESMTKSVCDGDPGLSTYLDWAVTAAETCRGNKDGLL